MSRFFSQQPNTSQDAGTKEEFSLAHTQKSPSELKKDDLYVKMDKDGNYLTLKLLLYLFLSSKVD